MGSDTHQGSSTTNLQGTFTNSAGGHSAVMKEMLDAALANGMIEPTVDEIETEYHYCLALHFAAGLWLPSFIIGMTSPIIMHILYSNVGPQQTSTSGH